MIQHHRMYRTVSERTVGGAKGNPDQQSGAGTDREAGKEYVLPAKRNDGKIQESIFVSESSIPKSGTLRGNIKRAEQSQEVKKRKASKKLFRNSEQPDMLF